MKIKIMIQDPVLVRPVWGAQKRVSQLRRVGGPEPLLGVFFSLNFGGVFATGASHDSPRAQTCTFEGPGLQKHHQNSTRRHPERDKKSKNGAGEGKNSEILGGPAEGRSSGRRSWGGRSEGHRVEKMKKTRRGRRKEVKIKKEKKNRTKAKRKQKEKKGGKTMENKENQGKTRK